MILVFTLCSNNYLAQAITLGDSLLSHNPDYKFVIGLVDKKISLIDYSLVPYDIIELEKINIASFGELIQKFNITELNTAVKPFYFQYLFDTNETLSSVIYLDPDIFVYAAFADLEKELKTSDIIITPHFTNPLDDDKLQSEEDFLNSGLYNLGFIAIKRTINSRKMLNWWAERLRVKAFIDFKRGLFTDQIWINFVPLFFKNVRIFTHKGYNMAYWNLHERKLGDTEGHYIINDEYPLVFYHFSGFNPMTPDVISKYQNRFNFEERHELIKFFELYSSQLFQNGYKIYLNYKNEFAERKETLERRKRKEVIRKIPFWLRIIRILILKLNSKYNLYLD